MYQLRFETRLGFDTGLTIIVGELYYMLPVTSQVKHLILFPGIEHIKIHKTKYTENQLKYYQILSNFKYHQSYIKQHEHLNNKVPPPQKYYLKKLVRYVVKLSLNLIDLFLKLKFVFFGH